jgi:hypothetical protein
MPGFELIESVFAFTIDKIENGKVLWRSTDDIDVEALGLFLTHHLVTENHLDHYIEAVGFPRLTFKETRMSFTQKVDLLANDEFVRDDTRALLKHFNKLRNKYAHNPHFTPSKEDIAEFRTYTRKSLEHADEGSELQRLNPDWAGDTDMEAVSKAVQQLCYDLERLIELKVSQNWEYQQRLNKIIAEGGAP